MKTTYTSLWTVLLSTGLMAQTVSTAPTAVPLSDPAPAPMAAAAPATAPAKANPPAAKPAAKKKTVKAGTKKPVHPKVLRHSSTNGTAHAVAAKPVAAGTVAQLVNLIPGPAVVSGHTINVRARASLAGEVIAKLNAGDAVCVIESVAVEKPKKGEPAQWAKIAFPTNALAWVFADFIDPTNKTVLPAHLNVRAGHGENYGVVGTLNRGDVINELLVKNGWIQIAPPPNAFAFIAAEFLKQEAPATPAAPAPVTTPEVAPAPTETNVVATTAAVAPPPSATANVPPSVPAAEGTNAPAPVAAIATNPPVAVTATTNEPAPPTVIEEVPPAKRIVQREGLVRGTWSIQAPSPVELANPDTGATMDYLYSPSPQVNLKRYKGLHVMVTGEEGLDKRWKNVPVLTIQKIQVLE